MKSDSARIERNINDALEFLTRVQALLSYPETSTQAAVAVCVRAAIEATRGAQQILSLEREGESS